MDETTQGQPTEAQPSLRSDGRWWIERNDGWYVFDQGTQRWVKPGDEAVAPVEKNPRPKTGIPARGRWLATILSSKLALAVVGLALFLLGVGVGSVSPDGAAQDGAAAEAREDVEQLEAQLERERDARESASERAEYLNGQVIDLRSEVTDLERQLQEPEETPPDSGGGGGKGGGGGSGGGGSGGSQVGAQPFGDGTWRVGADIQPGTYRAPGGPNCYWERLRNFKGGLNSIIVNGGFSRNQTVTIDPSDAGFSTRSCGTWQPL